jgi:hypothetical protein
VETELRGALDSAGCCDTYELWRRPGRYDYVLRAFGIGALRLVIEANHPGDPPVSPGDGWRTVAESLRTDGGSRSSGLVEVPAVQLSAAVAAPWVRLRVTVSRLAGGSGSVAYEFSLASVAARRPPTDPAAP